MGCRVKKAPKNKQGKQKLAFRLIFRLPDGREIRSWEGVDLEATGQNERLLRARAILIEDEIRTGAFDYLKHFPHGNKASFFIQQRQSGEAKTIRQYYQSWKRDKQPPFVKKSRAQKYESHFENHILPLHGGKYLEFYGVAEIRELRADLIEAKKLKMKTAKNVINATLRAFFRDARAEGLIEKNPFDELPRRWWPKSAPPPPDPFSEKERDEILGHFKAKHLQSWGPGFVFLYCLFWTGARPSELTARTWRDYDPRTRKLAITSSRVAGEEGSTKTAASKRTIELLEPVASYLNAIRPLHARPDDHIFLNKAGKPIDQKEFAERHFWPALTVLKIRHRDFYATRDTFISVNLSHGEIAKRVAEYCGTSLAMIEQSYGKWIGTSQNFGAAALAAANHPGGEKTGEKIQQAPKNNQKLQGFRVVRGRGLEPLPD